eukprot:jgi/Ulvmu1/10230/UM060_0031.1
MRQWGTSAAATNFTLFLGPSVLPTSSMSAFNRILSAGCSLTTPPKHEIGKDSHLSMTYCTWRQMRSSSSRRRCDTATSLCPAAYSWHPETRRKLREMAQQFHISHSGMHGIGDTWLGPTPAVIRLARAALPLLRQLLSATFEETGDSDSSLSDWLEDIDWEDLASPSSSAGLQPWNMGHAVKYAAEIAVHTLPDNWAWDTRLGPSTGAQQVGTMHDAAVIPPVLGNGAFDLHQLLRNTHAYCAAWAAGNKGQPGSLVHFAGLIACQGSETVAPREEQRYADTVQAPTPKQRRT